MKAEQFWHNKPMDQFTDPEWESLCDGCGKCCLNKVIDDETEELFYQIKGDIQVTIQQDGKAVKVPIKEGEMFLLPAKIPHSPGRSDKSIGLVIERVRKGTNYKDGLMWFCDKCNTKLYEEYFQLEDVEKDFLPVFKRFFNSEENRTCNNCNHVMQTDPRFTDGE